MKVANLLDKNTHFKPNNKDKTTQHLSATHEDKVFK